MEIEQKLAIHGGKKTINHKFKKYNPIGNEEITSVSEVMKTGVLSQFIGGWGADFYGGAKVKEFEKACQEYFGVKYAVTVNSWTSGLIAAVGAIGIEPGDEVIVSTWTMCASATAIIHWNAIPVFADINPDTFNIDIESIKKNITSKTRAIMAIDIFGHSCDIESIMDLAKEYDLKVITDTAQAPGAIRNGKYVGTQSHVGGFSLNYHKHIHTGEGGVLVTNDFNIYEKLQLIRNHAEAVVEKKGHEDITNMIGYNFRMGEIEAAIGIEQLKKLESLVAKKQKAADYLINGLKDLKGLTVPSISENNTHAFYMVPLVLDTKLLGVDRKHIADALIAEGIQGLSTGYVCVHLLPMYQKKIAFGRNGYPWKDGHFESSVNYGKGICPVAENLHKNTFFALQICLYEYTDTDLKNIILAFKKVWSQIDKL